ncbi:alpha/beta hydrolase [Luteibacter yeojuensis]|uniref:alpha/beta hydrolase n=1 Tax=Luteibacter yeojuensis TaxID=345309 RepID=UPI000A04C306|nr:alpha/beta hydrolase-fold protein [Luteibacter yeojuensis]
MVRCTWCATLAACLLIAACSQPAPPSQAPQAAAAPGLSTTPVPVHASTVAGVPVEAVQRYVLDDTEVRTVHARNLGRDYQVFVSLPPDYAAHPDRTYPVMFVTDANYAFPLIRSIARRLGDHGDGTEDFILVGLSYAVGDTPVYSRRRDYTPTNHGPSGLTSDMPGRPVLHGEAEGYRAFIKDDVFPLIAANYHADMSRRIYVGHSYGGLLGYEMLLHDPSMFSHYILGSPSLQFDHGVEFARMHEALAARKDLPANVLVVLGAFETPGKDKADRRYNRETDMIGDNRRFVAELQAKHYPGLHASVITVPGEDHLTVFPVIITRGIQWALPGKRPAFTATGG